MMNNKTRKGTFIMSTRKTTTERIAEQKARMAQMENEMKRLQNQHKAEERKKRDRRIYTRGAHMESLLPDTIGLSDTRFFTFLERTVANKFGRDVLDKLKAEQDKDDATNGTDDTNDGSDTPADPAPVATAQGGKPSAHKSTAPSMNGGDYEDAVSTKTSASPVDADGSRTENGEKQGA